MTQLLAGLIGVILGAVVSEGLRVWHDGRAMRRSARGRLRLLRNEMAMTLSYFDQPDLTADDIRAGIKRGIIRDDQWLAGQATLSEALTTDQWVTLSAPYLGVQMLLGESKDSDEEYVKIARLVAQQMGEARDTVWQHERTPKRLRDRLTGNAG
jgi:hypothetical protein